MSHSLNSRIRASAIEQYKTTLATHDKEMEDDGVPLSRYLFNVKYVIHDTPGIYLGNPADNATLGNGASYFVQMVPKGSMPFVSEYRPPNNQDIEFLPAVPVCCPAPNLMAMAPPQMVVGCSNHCKIIVWVGGFFILTDYIEPSCLIISLDL
ncbi:hypothetical protein NLI96_g11694 [Meripilus lineatus]|uniref:Uncharacterized protein n=1 Tax=Meripilus lineatus TaxID=2056292 RepID=A0AAD5UTR5_9APHY|nr:hypothetical protein NLI96_g11694 [Physisporinus lineatus]